ncbi:hypothetical protein L7F22_019273 [Adiantum nelumboides]|nr:hypothetical protein [Adiantum nelumboides]
MVPATFGVWQTLLESLDMIFEWVKSPADIQKADKLIFPGVGAFGPAMESLNRQGYSQPLKEFIASGKPYMGICIGMQTLFESSTEAPNVPGLGIVPGEVDRFDAGPSTSTGAIKSVPQMDGMKRIHVRRGNVYATQFHPEKSGRAGLEVLLAWLSEESEVKDDQWIVEPAQAAKPAQADGLTKRVVACLDVRSNDDGDLVVTKGESYDVREKEEATEVGGQVRNLGKPVDLALRYYLEGADEIVFLNITSFRSCPLQDQPMLSVLSSAAESIFVPLTIGGGIKDSVDPDGTKHSAKEVADEYFRAGADKVSIGSEAVLAVEELLQRAGSKDVAQVKEENLTGKTGIEEISKAYGKQAVVVSIDPRRVYLEKDDEVDLSHRACVIEGEKGSRYDGKKWWYRCTIKGGREDRDVDVVQLAKGVERLGAGEILVNSIDQDGQSKGFDRQLIDLVRSSVSIPVVASSGAGSAQHFEEIFAAKPLSEKAEPSSVEAALAAGIFHRKEVGIEEVKSALAKKGFKVRREKIEEGASGIVQKATEQERKA